jgi:hypothetical protein
VLVLGIPYFARLLGGVLEARGWEADYAPHPGRDLLGWIGLLPRLWRADVLYHISSRVDRRSPQAFLSRVWRKPLVIHWVGTDVLVALDEHRRGNTSHGLLSRAVHWCDAPWLAEELAEMGVQADYQPLPIVGMADVAPPLPAEFRALLYLPADPAARRVFDTETLLRLPRELPEIEFILIPSPANSLPGPLPPNVETHGWEHDMDAVYRRVTVLVRLTSHDGTSFMSIEAMSRGRYVIWTYPMTGVIQADGLPAVVAVLRDLSERHKRAELPLNEEGMRFARENFDSDQIAAEIDRRLRALIRRRA